MKMNVGHSMRLRGYGERYSETNGSFCFVFEGKLCRRMNHICGRNMIIFDRASSSEVFKTKKKEMK